MPHGGQRMIEDHALPGKAHDLPDSLPHVWLIAMHLAVRAKGLGFHKRTFVAALSCIPVKLCTVLTKPLFCLVLLFAV